MVLPCKTETSVATDRYMLNLILLKKFTIEYIVTYFD